MRRDFCRDKLYARDAGWRAFNLAALLAGRFFSFNTLTESNIICHCCVNGCKRSVHEAYREKFEKLLHTPRVS